MKLFILFLLFSLDVFSQNTIGLPEVINYSKQTYGAGLQNWEFKQDKNGIIYVANNEGLLTFDGNNWILYPLPNKTIVRSVCISSDNRIYTGGQDELGYFIPSKNGRLEYISLVAKIPQQNRSFGDVWDIVEFNKSLFFRTQTAIIKLTGETITLYNTPTEWTFLGAGNGQLFAQEQNQGIRKFENNAWNLLDGPSNLPPQESITAIIPLRKDSFLITTLKFGLFILNQGKIIKLQSENDVLFKSKRIYDAILIENNRIALATNNNGIYIIDEKAHIIQSFSKIDGLQNNNVLSVFLDNQHNLWLGLDNGIDFIAYDSPVKHITSFSGDGGGYTAAIYNNQFFAGTTDGLYQFPLQILQDFSFSRGSFEEILNTKGQNWGLAILNNQLLLGNHEGAYVIKNKTAEKISTDGGYWTFTNLSNSYPAKRILAGNYRGLQFFDFNNERFVQGERIPGFDESSRFIVAENENSFWVSHPYHGISKISKNPETGYSIQSYSVKNGLPSNLNNQIFKIKNEIVVATENGIYLYNKPNDRFEIHPAYKKIIGNLSIRYLKEDQEGNVWFVNEKTPGVIDFKENKNRYYLFPELTDKILSGFEFLYPVDNQNIIIGGVKGFYHLNFKKYKELSPDLHVHIRNVKISQTKDSLLFGGYFSGINLPQIQQDSQIYHIKNQWKNIRIEYSSSLFGLQQTLEYSYRLNGLESNWSQWTKRTEKEFTNLPAGKYSFEIKVRNNVGFESPINAYKFEILPPWYQSVPAYFGYIFILGAFILSIDRLQRRKYKAQLQKYEKEQKRLLYIHELEKTKSETELVSLRNEKLENELNYKNSELASSAMHLVKKGELLNKVKAELTQITKILVNKDAITELKKLIRSLNMDEQLDDDWDNFSRHFDKVHSDFLLALKQKHPNVTPNELKLCAYLRMNLSTKEIAQLMNISVRGVEISRYRLRKKLGITSDVNLFDYLIEIN